MSQSRKRYMKRHSSILNRKDVNTYLNPACAIHEILMDFIDLVRANTQEEISFDNVCNALSDQMPSQWFSDNFHEFAESHYHTFHQFLYKKYPDPKIIAAHLSELYTYNGIFTLFCLFMRPQRPNKPYSEYTSDKEYMKDMVCMNDDFRFMYERASNGLPLI